MLPDTNVLACLRPLMTPSLQYLFNALSPVDGRSVWVIPASLRSLVAFTEHERVALLKSLSTPSPPNPGFSHWYITTGLRSTAAMAKIQLGALRRYWHPSSALLRGPVHHPMRRPPHLLLAPHLWRDFWTLCMPAKAFTPCWRLLHGQERNNNRKLPKPAYIDKNKDKRYKRFMKHHKQRVNMQKAIRRIVRKRLTFTTDPHELSKLAKSDAQKLLAKRKGATMKHILKGAKDLFHHLKNHFWNMCDIANYRFPPNNFDRGMAILVTNPPPTEPTTRPTPPAENKHAYQLFTSHPVYSQRLIAVILRAGMSEQDNFVVISELESESEADSNSDNEASPYDIEPDEDDDNSSPPPPPHL